MGCALAHMHYRAPNPYIHSLVQRTISGHLSAITQLCMVMRYRSLDGPALQKHLANAFLAVHSFGPVYCIADSLLSQGL